MSDRATALKPGRVRGLRNRDVGMVSFVWILLTSGTVLPNTTENIRITLVISGFLLAVQLILLLTQVRKRLSFGAIATYVAMVGIVVITMVANSDLSSYLTYARLLVAVGLACGCALLVDKSAAIRVFVTVISAIAAVSLVFFYGESVERIPSLFNIRSLNETTYYNAYLYLQLVADASRNTAIYIEPGLYQIYLCLALMALLYAGESFRYKYLKILVLGLAIASTNSTAGYIAGLLVVSGLVFKYSATKFRYVLATIRLALVAIVVAYSVNSSYFIGNIESKFLGQSQLSWLGRRDSTLADLKIIWESPFFGTGAGNYMRDIDVLGAIGYEIAAATNTYTQLAAVFGLLFVVPVLALQLGSLKRASASVGIKFLLAGVWAISFLNQPFLMYAFFYLPAFLYFNRGLRPVESQAPPVDRMLNESR